jgi:CxxC motif-containing protein
MTLPKRLITNTMRIEGGLHPVIPVKTDKVVPGKKIFDIVNIISNNKVKAPITAGDIIIENVAGTNANIVASKTDYGKK